MLLSTYSCNMYFSAAPRQTVSGHFVLKDTSLSHVKIIGRNNIIDTLITSFCNATACCLGFLHADSIPNQLAARFRVVLRKHALLTHLATKSIDWESNALWLVCLDMLFLPKLVDICDNVFSIPCIMRAMTIPSSQTCGPC